MREITKSRLREINYKLWSLIVRNRCKSVCAKCYLDNLAKGMTPEEAKEKATKHVDAHHIFEKGMNHSLMFDLDNGICLCFYHHKYWIHSIAIPEKDREDFIIKVIGPDKYEELWWKSKQIVKTNLAFYVENFQRLYDIAMAENLRPDKIVPKYIVEKLYEEVKDD
jgi:hypothetical protein